MSDSVIGIISYLPNDKKIRNNRLTKLKELIKQCNLIFNNLSIMIIAQNWTEEEKLSIFNNTNIVGFFFDKLGIVGARNKLREIFLASNYNYLIMLDDDVKLIGKAEQGKEYLRQLHLYKSGFWEFNLTLLKLFAISKDLFQLEKFDENINPENGDGFEDRIFVNKLRTKYPHLKHEFKVKDLYQNSISTKDSNSTWYTNQDIADMRNKTLKMIANMNTKLNDNQKR